MEKTEKILVAHLGARRHYAEIRMLAAHGRLEHFYTDLCASAGPARWISRLPFQPAGLRRLLGRRPPVAPGLVTHFPSLGLRYFWLRKAARTGRDLLRADLWAGGDFCRRVLSRGLGQASGVYTFNSAGLELLREARRLGLAGYTDQTIAPLKTERLLLSVEQQKWPGWEPAEARPDEWNRSVDREESEWAEAGTILCGSDFVAEAVAAAGGPRHKCRVIQFGLATGPAAAPPPRPEAPGRPRPLRVLTVGAVGLRKGSPYVLQCARRLKGLAEFRLVGGLGGLLPAALDRLSRETDLQGPAPRSAMAGHYAWADVFFLPSVCEGSAMACFEALAAGLPVVTTPNAGSVVQDGIEGFIVPAGETGLFCEKIARLADNPRLRARLGRAALKRSDRFSLEKRSGGFLEALGLRP